MTSVIKAPINCLEIIKGETASLDKATKMVKTGYSALVPIVGSYEPMTNLVKVIEPFNGLFAGLHILNRVSELASGKWMFWDKKVVGKNIFSDDGKFTAQKTVGNIFLTTAHAIEFASFGAKLGFYSLGSALVPLTLAKNILYLPASSLAISDAVEKMKNADQYVKNAANKVNKWADRLVEPQDPQLSVKDGLAAKYKAKIYEAEKKIADTTNPISSKEKEKLQRKLLIWNQYVEELDSVGDVKDLPQDSALKTISEYKITAWTANLGKVESNRGKEKTKSWLTIVESVGKIAFGILALVGLVFGIALTPAFMITLAVGLFVTNTIGLSKILYGKYNSMEKIQKPHTLDYRPV